VLRDVKLVNCSHIPLLGSHHDKVAWKQRGADVVISVPAVADGDLPFEGPRTFRVEGVQ
jgi:hypothetical protein